MYYENTLQSFDHLDCEKCPRTPFTHAKRLFDLLFGSFFLLLVLPLFAVVLLVGLFQKGSGFYLHKRIGRYGKVFNCVKLRTMLPDADVVLKKYLASNPAAAEEWALFGKLHNDPRITRMGKIMRRLSLDELPQLLNVVKGDMTVVGPRPVTSNELMQHYDPRARAAYLTVRPGLTGLWQVSGRNRLGYKRRAELDLQYVQTPSFLREMGIVWKTITVVWSGDGAG